MNKKTQQYIVDKPANRCRYVRNLKNELHLWEPKEPVSPLLIRLSCLAYWMSFGGCVLALSLLMLRIINDHGLSIATFVYVGFGVLGLVLTATHWIILCFQKKSSCEKRTQINLTEFIGESPLLLKLDKSFIIIVREVFGHVYRIAPEIIKANDTGDSLRKFGVFLEPFGFEIVRGVFQKLQVMPKDDQVDMIVQNINDHANTVEDVIVILGENLEKTNIKLG